MKRIVVIGQGNVAWHLCRWLAPIAEVIHVNSRSLEGLPAKADLYIISVSDGAIVSVAQKLTNVDGVVVHTSGSSDIDTLPAEIKRRGVLYPMQTFTKGKELEYNTIPLFVEGNDSSVEQYLLEVATLMSGNVQTADSDKRRRIHLSAVFACNYVNYLFTLAEDVLKIDGLNLSLLYPLIDETINKSRSITPEQAQTGPARRHDMVTIAKHEALLSDYTEMKKLYGDMAAMIMARYPKQ
jgi:predicted short-subunit dehydrogenase-like oxidoreductase (DUF2520 family)